MFSSLSHAITITGIPDYAFLSALVIKQVCDAGPGTKIQLFSNEGHSLARSTSLLSYVCLRFDNCSLFQDHKAIRDHYRVIVLCEQFLCYRWVLYDQSVLYMRKFSSSLNHLPDCIELIHSGGIVF